MAATKQQLMITERSLKVQDPRTKGKQSEETKSVLISDLQEK